jgi:hypothetical protein
MRFVFFSFQINLLVIARRPVQIRREKVISAMQKKDIFAERAGTAQMMESQILTTLDLRC